MTAAHVHFFFGLRDQIKLYHWQTTSYARHKATDDVIKELDGNIDSFEVDALIAPVKQDLIGG